MITSSWKIFTDSKKLASAEKILNRVKKVLNRELYEIRWEKHHKDDTVIYYYKLQHDLNSRADLLYEVMILADMLASEWQLYGAISIDPEAYSSSSSISGVDTIQWFISWGDV